MLNIIALAAETMPFGERASTAGVVTLQGMLTIFLVLGILWGCIELMHLIVHRKDPKTPKAPKETRVPAEKKASKKAEPVPNDADAAVAAAIAAALAASEDDGATVAAITAAISAALAEDGYTGGFRVVSFKRVNTKYRNRI